MAWTYTQSFDSLNTATLNGQDSWGGGTNPENFAVSEATFYDGTKCMRHTSSTEDTISRSITATTDGKVKFVLRKASVAVASPKLGFRFQSGSTVAFKVTFGGNSADDKIQFLGNDLGTGLSANTWYLIEVEYDCGTDQARARLDGGSWTSQSNFTNAVTSIDTITLEKENGASDPVYFDALGPNSTTYTLSADTATMTLTGVAATLTKIGQIYTLVADTASLILTGIASTFNLKGWTFQSKNSASYTNQTKNSASWTNQTKN